VIFFLCEKHGEKPHKRGKPAGILELPRVKRGGSAKGKGGIPRPRKPARGLVPSPVPDIREREKSAEPGESSKKTQQRREGKGGEKKGIAPGSGRRWEKRGKLKEKGGGEKRLFLSCRKKKKNLATFAERSGRKKKKEEGRRGEERGGGELTFTIPQVPGGGKKWGGLRLLFIHKGGGGKKKKWVAFRLLK